MLQCSRATLHVLVSNSWNSNLIFQFSSSLSLTLSPCLVFPRPYDDPWIITGQILTIVSVFFAWICWVTFIVGFIGLTLFQLLWCVRMRGGILVGQAVIAGLTSVANLGIAIYALVAWRKKRYCEVFVWYTNDYYYDDDTRNWPNTDYCHEKTWFAIALVCALLWAGAAFCMTWFVKSGRHAKWEKKYVNSSTTEVEITAAPASANIESGRETVIANVLETEKEDSVE